MTKYFTNRDDIEENALQGLSIFEAKESISNISVFPDIHYCSEKNLPVGVAFKSKDVFYPLITGKDMGCGVSFLRIDKKDYLTPFDKMKHYKAFNRESLTMTHEGLGSGNHFLSIEESEKYLYVLVHTGSRNLGIYMYQKMLGLINSVGDPVDMSLPISVANEEFVTDYNKVLSYASRRREEFLKKSFEFLVRNKYVKSSAHYEIKDSTHNHLTFGEEIIHRKGATELSNDEIVIPLSMTRGCLIVKPNVWDETLKESLYSCSHGAGRKLSRRDSSIYWYNLKKSEKEEYKRKFPELLNKQKEFGSYVQEFDFAYKNSESILDSQPYLISIDQTIPIVTVKLTEI